MIRYEDQGRYRCVADNRQTNVTVSDYAEITITRKLHNNIIILLLPIV